MMLISCLHLINDPASNLSYHNDTINCVIMIRILS